MSVVESAPVAADPEVDAAGCLLDVFADVKDPRQPQGRQFTVQALLAVTLAAIVGGARSWVGVGEWAADAKLAVLERLGITGPAPDESTIRRALQRLDADALDRALGRWMWLRTTMTGERRLIHFDGKTLKGARDAEGNLKHLLAGLCGRTATVLTQVDVHAKTNEVPKLIELLATLPDLTDAIVTADALHTTRGTAEAIHARGAHFVLTVKRNQPNLHQQLKELPWNDIPVAATSTEKGRGRIDTRTVKATGIAAGIDFPHAVQAMRIHRTRVTRIKGSNKTKKTRETVYVVTSLTAADATPEQIAAMLRRHWWIENRLHWVRDTAYTEDACTTRTGKGPQILASMRNTAISIFRLTGHNNIAKALRHHARKPKRVLQLLLTC